MTAPAPQRSEWGRGPCWWHVGAGRVLALSDELAAAWAAEGRRVVFGTHAEMVNEQAKAEAAGQAAEVGKAAGLFDLREAS